jgi:hypothetical protein
VSLVFDWPCALKILGFTLGTILKMKGSTWGFSLGSVTWEKKVMCLMVWIIGLGFDLSGSSFHRVFLSYKSSGIGLLLKHCIMLDYY